MKRLPVLLSGLLVCVLFGCGSESYEDLIKDTIKQINFAAVDIGSIRTKVQDAIKRTEGGKPLDLKEAVEATKNLKKTGEATQLLKRRIEQIRANVDDSQKKANAESQRGSLNAALTDLLKQKSDLDATLAEAERLPNVPNAKQAVKDFREKLVEALSPFEALSR
jgi:hypothetical protein